MLIDHPDTGNRLAFGFRLSISHQLERMSIPFTHFGRGQDIRPHRLAVIVYPRYDDIPRRLTQYFVLFRRQAAPQVTSFSPLTRTFFVQFLDRGDLVKFHVFGFQPEEIYKAKIAHDDIGAG